MRSHYKRIGDYVTQIKLKNTDVSITSLKGININKHFIPSVANINGTDLSKYRVVKKNQFAFNPMHVGRDEVLPISVLEEDEAIIISPAYVVFEVKDEEELLPAYLMMWCRRSEFDRNAWFMTDNSVRGGFSWADFCDMELPIPSIEKQREIVREYNVVNDRISLNEELTQKLEDTAQAIYKQWFVDFEFPISKEYAKSIGKPELEGKPHKSSGGEMEYCDELLRDAPSWWNVIELSSLVKDERPITYGVLKPEGFVDEGVRFVRGGDIVNGRVSQESLKCISDKVSKKYKRTILRGGEILIVLVGSPGLIALAPAALQNANVYRQIGIIDIANANQAMFVKVFLTSPQGQKALNDLVGGSVQRVINLAKLREMKMLLPEDDVVNDFGKVGSSLKAKMEATDDMTRSLKQLRSLLLSNLAKV